MLDFAIANKHDFAEWVKTMISRHNEIVASWVNFSSDIMMVFGYVYN